MVVDTSVLFAILAGEEGQAQFEELIMRSPPAVISIVSIIETTISLTRQRLPIDVSRHRRVADDVGNHHPAVDLTQGLLAQRAFLQFGRSRHPARLNFGDCFSYALAKVRGDTLLFKGEDFSKTDLVPAWRPSW